jgi:hypothetical protein
MEKEMSSETSALPGITQALFEFTGVPPGLLQHSAAFMEAEAPRTMASKKTPTAEEEAEAGCYRMESGQLYMPTIAFRSAAITAATGLRTGRIYWSQVVSSSVQVVDMITPLYHPGTKEPITSYETHICRAVIPSTGAAVRRARPLVKEWQCRVSFELDPLLGLTVDILEQCLERAGRIVGVGDFRPQRKKGQGGPFGRFTVRRIA